MIRFSEWRRACEREKRGMGSIISQKSECVDGELAFILFQGIVIRYIEAQSQGIEYIICHLIFPFDHSYPACNPTPSDQLTSLRSDIVSAQLLAYSAQITHYKGLQHPHIGAVPRSVGDIDQDTLPHHVLLNAMDTSLRSIPTLLDASKLAL